MKSSRTSLTPAPHWPSRIISKAGTSWARDDSAETERTTPGAHASTTDALEIAAAELEKILTLDPQNITARVAAHDAVLEQGHIEAARNDLDLILYRPNLLAALRKNPQLFPVLSQGGPAVCSPRPDYRGPETCRHGRFLRHELKQFQGRISLFTRQKS